DAVNPIEIPENGGNPSTNPEPTTPTNPTDNQDNTGKDKPNVGGQDKDPALENAEKLVKEAKDAIAKAQQAKADADAAAAAADTDENGVIKPEEAAAAKQAVDAANAKLAN
ncbi:hypothetical protein P9074_12465, partial [Gallibacterium anatis]|uniref:hypothetical protein n=1 Tax=Gallibacterium anatis TaxID=750 RepID=UPI003006FE39